MTDFLVAELKFVSGNLPELSTIMREAGLRRPIYTNKKKDSRQEIGV